MKCCSLSLHSNNVRATKWRSFRCKYLRKTPPTNIEFSRCKQKQTISYRVSSKRCICAVDCVRWTNKRSFLFLWSECWLRNWVTIGSRTRFIDISVFSHTDPCARWLGKLLANKQKPKKAAMSAGHVRWFAYEPILPNSISGHHKWPKQTIKFESRYIWWTVKLWHFNRFSFEKCETRKLVIKCSRLTTGSGSIWRLACERNINGWTFWHIDVNAQQWMCVCVVATHFRQCKNHVRC